MTIQGARPDLNPINVVNASAGTGKTHRLTQTVADALAAGLAPERVLATTFTRRAADELVERARAFVLDAAPGSQGAARAARLLAARIGTVNSIFGALVNHFAVDTGRSPATAVVPDDDAGGDRLFAVAADEAIARHATALRPLAESFGYAERDIDWMSLVRQLVERARQNGLGSEDLTHSADRSVATLLACLPPAGSLAKAGEFDAALLAAVRDAADGAVEGDSTQATRKAVELVRDAAAAIERDGTADWALWAKLSKLKAGARSDGNFEGVRAAAARHASHPRLRTDLEHFIRALFSCAAEALDAFQTWKRERGLVDFADQEAEALAALDAPSVLAQVRDQVGLLLVDEFQDTSPIQLALFLKLAAVVERSIWVGDPKQSIYGFRGADPDLMAAVAAGAPGATGGRADRLDLSRRSSPKLVRFLDAVFVPAFAAAGLPEDRVRLGGSARKDAPTPSAALAVWRLEAANRGEESAALAAGVAQTLEHAADFPIVPKGATVPRPLCGGDIAVLCRSHARRLAVAEALRARGVAVASSQARLLDSAPCALVLAGLRWAADPSDTLALAEMLHLGAPDVTWLALVLAGGDKALADALPAASRLRALGRRLLHLSPSEALDETVAALDVTRFALALDEPLARLADLEGLRGTARAYEDECRTNGAPASATGYVSWIARAEAERPASPDPEAVTVTTYHAAKGLEWPVVVLADLAEPPGVRLFDQVVAESDPETFDWRRPLDGRWLRFWPWPYGRQVKDVPLGAAAADSALGRSADVRQRAETVRLLYVGMTRARDRLVFAARARGTSLETAWLETLRDGADRAVLSLDIAASRADAGGVPFDLDVESFRHDTAASPAPFLGPCHGPDASAATGTAWSPYRQSPSALPPAEGPWPFETTVLGPRLPLAGVVDARALGEAVHSFLAADPIDGPESARLAMAEELLRGWSVSALSPRDLVVAADRLWAYFRERWADGTLRREWPVAGARGRQRMAGRLDVVLETEAGLVIIDHKSFPGAPVEWPELASRHGPQLAAYADLCEAATGRPVCGTVLHLPVGGVLLEIARTRPG
jgi:ATP-dependent exoDNAse (exonuclease V) beta subunit